MFRGEPVHRLQALQGRDDGRPPLRGSITIGRQAPVEPHHFHLPPHIGGSQSFCGFEEGAVIRERLCRLVPMEENVADPLISLRETDTPERVSWVGLHQRIEDFLGRTVLLAGAGAVALEGYDLPNVGMGIASSYRQERFLGSVSTNRILILRLTP